MAATKVSTVEPYYLDPQFERACVLLACSRPAFFGRVGYAIEPDALAGEPARLAITAAQAIGRDLGHGPESTVLVVQRLRRLMNQGQITLEQVLAVNELFDQAEDESAGALSEDGVITELAPIIQRRAQMAALHQAASTFAKREDMTAAREMFEAADRIGIADISIGTRLGTSSFAVIDSARNMQRLPTGIFELDAILSGGVPRGQTAMWIGDSGGGKSMGLAHIAAESCYHGLFVGYATLELPEQIVLARLKANLTDVPIDVILEGSMDTAKRRIAELEPTLGACVVKAFTPHATTVPDLIEWVKRCEDRESRMMDLLVVDYADKLTAPKSGEKGDYQTGRVVYEGLRVFGEQRGMWVWTASQASRPGKESSKKIDLQHVADSMHKVRVVDIVITLNLREEGEQMVFYVAKNRTGAARKATAPLPVDFACGRIAPVGIRKLLP